jgi:Pericentrin-AKAP-450 domain of centrosomal targeting protein
VLLFTWALYVYLPCQIQRLYSKYLRAESFRKSLIYQKKYLLLLIGGFQDGEQETLAMISRMGAFPSCNDLHERRIQPISRFRTAARVIIAISRYVSGCHHCDVVQTLLDILQC